jgi:hypothetical protein
MQEMCFQKGHNWNDLPFYMKRGSFIMKNTYEDIENENAIRTKWELIETPIKFSENDFLKFLK